MSQLETKGAPAPSSDDPDFHDGPCKSGDERPFSEVRRAVGASYAGGGLGAHIVSGIDGKVQMRAFFFFFPHVEFHFESRSAGELQLPTLLSTIIVRSK